MSCNCEENPLILPIGPQGEPGPIGTAGLTGRGVAVFVGTYTPYPTNANCATNYATVPGFGTNAIPGSLNLKPGDLWIVS